MKKILISCLCLFFTSLLSVSQTSSRNADGSLKVRGNVAIFVNGSSYSFEHGRFTKKVDDAALDELKTAMNALVIQEFQNMAFGVVNRDNEATLKVNELIQENRLEEYISGLSIQAKNQGADYLYIVDITMYSEGNSTCQEFFSSRLINVANNVGWHNSVTSEVWSLRDENDMRKKAKAWIDEISYNVKSQIMELFLEQYAIFKMDGKKLYLTAYQPNGGIHQDDVFYAFQWQDYRSRVYQQKTYKIFNRVGEAKYDGAENGYLVVKSNKKIDDPQKTIIFRNTENPKFGQANNSVTFFGFNTSINSYEGFVKNRINNAFYSAITRHPGLLLIEHDHLSDLKQERELQKSEDFIDGHVVKKIAAIGANILLHIDDFKIDGTQVSFRLSSISVADNRIVKTVDVTTSIDNIENEIYKQVCERFLNPGELYNMNKDQIELFTNDYDEGNQFIMIVNKEFINPITSESSYQLVEVCKMTETERKGNLSIFKVKDILSEEDYNNIAEYSNSGRLYLKIDASSIKTENGKKSKAQKVSEKTEKKEKVKDAAKKGWNIVKGAAKNAAKKATITVNGKRM